MRDAGDVEEDDDDDEDEEEEEEEDDDDDDDDDDVVGDLFSSELLFCWNSRQYLNGLESSFMTRSELFNSNKISPIL